MLRTARSWVHQASRGRYSPRGYFGPIKLRLIREDYSSLLLDLSKPEACFQALAQEKPEHIIGLMMLLSKGTWSGQVQFVGVNAAIGNASVGECASADDCWEQMLNTYEAWKEQVRLIESDPAVKLDYLLKRLDWTAGMSDDASVWAANERAWTGIREAMLQVDPKVAYSLWEKHCPDVNDYSYPGPRVS